MLLVATRASGLIAHRLHMTFAIFNEVSLSIHLAQPFLNLFDKNELSYNTFRLAPRSTIVKRLLNALKHLNIKNVLGGYTSEPSVTGALPPRQWRVIMALPGPIARVAPPVIGVVFFKV